MKIALIGYGRMGRELEKEALAKGHTIDVIIDNEQDWKEKSRQLALCDAAIEFTHPETAIININRCFDAGIPVVTGTTGWHERLAEVTDDCAARNGTLFYASNFSIGVNIFFSINRQLASLMQQYGQYMPSITETHHVQKLDAPSGTAITLANGIVASNGRITRWTAGDAKPGELPVRSVREGTVAGLHTVEWKSEVDRITIEHEAYSRKGFAEGALLAAAWLQGRKGVFTMSDLLDDK